MLLFLRRYTLPVAIVVGSLVFALFHEFAVLQPIAKAYVPWNNTVLSTLNFIVLYFTFCKINFQRMRPRRWHAHVIVAQLFLAVCVLSIAFVLRDSPGLSLLSQAALVCVVAPSASAAAVVTAKLGGDLEQMITFTLLSNVFCAMLIPSLLPYLPGAAAEHDITPMSLALSMLWRVVMVLLVPMLAAWLTRVLLPRLHRAIVDFRNLSFYAWAVSLMVVSGTAVKGVVDLWDDTPGWLLFAVATVGLLICGIQFFIGRRLGALTLHRIEGGQGLGQKNTVFAIWLSASFLHPLACLGPGCYILWQNLINSWQIRKAEKKLNPVA